MHTFALFSKQGLHAKKLVPNNVEFNNSQVKREGYFLLFSNQEINTKK
jgi:hypothetical protein